MREENLLQFPSCAAVGFDLILRDVGVVDPEVRRIPGDAASLAAGDVSEEQSFGNEAFEFEIAAGFGLAAFAGVEPLALVTGGTRQRRRRRFEGVHF